MGTNFRKLICISQCDNAILTIYLGFAIFILRKCDILFQTKPLVSRTVTLFPVIVVISHSCHFIALTAIHMLLL